MTMTTADYLALSPQERWALIEEHLYGFHVVAKSTFTGGALVCDGDEGWPPRDFDEPNGWMELLNKCGDYEVARWGKSFWCQVFTRVEGEARIGIGDAPVGEEGKAVQVASLRAVGFLTD